LHATSRLARALLAEKGMDTNAPSIGPRRMILNRLFAGLLGVGFVVEGVMDLTGAHPLGLGSLFDYVCIPGGIAMIAFALLGGRVVRPATSA
jgi:hypothetical protein